jgi:replication factor C subunit 2/4
MEETSNITRFCFICNYINQIIEPINSRCVKIRFKPINKELLINQLSKIANKEKININATAVNSIAEISNGDLRKSILMLQNIKYIKNNECITKCIINKNDIYDMCKFISEEELESYINKINSDKKITNVIKITKDIINRGFVFNSIIIKIIEYIVNNEMIVDTTKAKILFEISSIEKNINDGADEYIQLLKLFNNFTIDI